MKKSLTLMAIATAILALMQIGCGTFGNGKIDPGGHTIVDLSQVDIDVSFVADDGRTFKIHRTPQGLDVEGEFIESKTGLVFTLGEGVGAFTVRDPRSGLQVAIKPKTHFSVATESAPPPK